MEAKPHYYSNPAFCQQSEFYTQQRTLSPQRSVRQSPVGAQTSHTVLDTSQDGVQNIPEERADRIEEQEFYEEVIVDDQGFIKDKKVVVVAQNNEGQKYIQVPQSERQGSIRYGSMKQIQYSAPRTIPTQKPRYEYIAMQEQDSGARPKVPPKQLFQEDVEVAHGVVHRYAVIDPEEQTDLAGRGERYALVPLNQLGNVLPTQNRYEYLHSSPPRSATRYEYLQQSTPQKSAQGGGRYEYPHQPHSSKPGTNPVATQKLHELLCTPKKSRTGHTPQKMLSPQLPRRLSSPPLSPISKDPFQTPRASPQRVCRLPPHSRAQQKLNYAIGAKQLAGQDKRLTTAIVPPMCSSPIQSIYGETTYSQKSESWMNLSMKGSASGRVLAVAALIMFLCGVVTTGLSFYMLSFMGRPYYLDFSTVAGFTCAVMGVLGFRSRNVYWLPNRNYLSGYLVLTVFSLLTCGGLLLLLVYEPRPGTPLADMTSAAVCGFSVLTLLLALTGVVSSYCCKYPPPDNRVDHCSPGLTV